MSTRSVVAQICGVVVLTLQGTVASGAPPDLHLINASYDETFFGDAAKVSGNLLVGLQMENSGLFNLRDIALQLPPEIKGNKVCVGIKTEDGRYLAQNPYALPKIYQSEIQGLETRSKFEDRLRKYTRDQVAVAARVVNDCDAPDDGTLLVATVTTDPKPYARGRVIVAQLNAEPEDVQSIVLFDPRDPKRELARADCSTRPTEVRISFTSSCKLPVPDDLRSGDYKLSVKIRERFKTVRTDFSVLINGQ